MILYRLYVFVGLYGYGYLLYKGKLPSYTLFLVFHLLLKVMNICVLSVRYFKYFILISKIRKDPV